MSQISSWKRPKAVADGIMLQEEEELDYEIELEDEDRLLESSDQECEESDFNDNSPTRTACQSPEYSESEESQSNNDKLTTKEGNLTQSRTNFREKMNYLKCRITYANSFRSNYRYFEPNSNFSDTTEEEEEVDEPNLCLDSINSQVLDTEASKLTCDEPVQNRYNDKDFSEFPPNHFIHNNNKETSTGKPTTIFHEQNDTNEDFPKNTNVHASIKVKRNIFNNTVTNSNAAKDPTEPVPAAKIFFDQNNTYKDVPKNTQTILATSSRKDVQTPIKTRKKSCRKIADSNTTLTSPNASTDPSEAVSATKVFYDQNNTYENVLKISQSNVATESQKNVQTPFKSLRESRSSVRKIAVSNNAVTSRNATTDCTGTVPTPKINYDKNNTNKDILESSETNVATPSPETLIKSRRTFCCPIRKTNTTQASPNKDPTKDVSTGKLFYDQNNTYEDVLKISQSNVATESQKNVHTPIKSFREFHGSFRKIADSNSTVTSPNATTDPTEAVPTTNIFYDQNNTNKDILKNSQTNVATPSPENIQIEVKSRKKICYPIRKTNTTQVSPNATTDPTKDVPTGKLFYDQNSQSNVASASQKKVQTPIKSLRESRSSFRKVANSNSTVTSSSATSDLNGAVPTANNTYEDFLKISKTNVAAQLPKNEQTPIESLKKNPFFFPKFTISNNTTRSPNTTIDPTKAVPPNLFNNHKSTYEAVPSTSKTNGAIQSSQNMQSSIQSPNFIRQITTNSELSTITGISNATASESPKKVQDTIKSQSQQQAEESTKSSHFIKKIGTGTARKASTETGQSSKLAPENVQGPIKPKIDPFNFKIQLKGSERSLLCPPEVLQLDPPPLQVDPPPPSNPKRAKKPFRENLNFEERTILFNSKDVSWYGRSYNADGSKNDNRSLERNINFKEPLKRPPFKPKWHTNSAAVEAPADKSVPVEDTTDIISLIGRTSISGVEDDSEEDTPLKKGDSPPGEDTLDKLDWVTTWFSKQPVPSIFKGLCYNHFLKNKYCPQNRCKNEHSLNAHFSRKCPLSNVTKEEIETGLSYARAIPSFYTQIFPIFAEFFGLRNDKDGLLYLVHQIFNATLPIKEDVALNTVLTSLQLTDLETLKESIDYVLLHVAFKSYTSLGAILFEIMISLEDIQTYWPIMRRMISGGLILNMALATKFVTSLVKKPASSEICADVYALYSKRQFFALPSINSKIRSEFFLMLGNSDGNMSNVALEKNSRNNVVNVGVPSSNPPAFQKQMPGGSCDNVDFASLCSGQQLVFDAPHFNRDDRVYGPKQHAPHNNVNKRQSNFFRYSSSDDNSSNSIDDPNTITYGNKFPDRSGLFYNREGPHYDPINDYVPHSKRKHQPQPLRNDSEPPKKKFQLNPGRLTIGTQTSNTLNVEFEETAVARPRQDYQYSKPPDKPVFGQLSFNPDYEFDVSLHNLYVPKIGSININEGDVFLLNKVLLLGTGNEFLRLLEKYQDPLTVQHFISMTLAHLKCSKQVVGRVWMRLLDSIGRAMPNFYGSKQIRAILEVISMNLLFVLVQFNLYSVAKDILMRFTDWDSLVTSRVLIIDPTAYVSLVGRYLFIAKLLQQTKPELCLEILTCPNLKLLENSSMWPYHEKKPIPLIVQKDLNNRNILLKLFLETSYLDNIQLVSAIYKIALSKESGIWEFDVIPYINNMIRSLVAEKKIIALKYLYNESNLIFNYIDMNVLKQFMIVMFSQLPENDGFRIFDKCASHSLYKPICINDTLQENIVIKTTYSNVEIEIIVKYCFHKLVEIRFLPSNGFKFWVQFATNPEKTTRVADEALRKRQAITKVKNKVIGMLQEFFRVLGRTTPGLSVVEVAKEDLISFLERY